MTIDKWHMNYIFISSSNYFFCNDNTIRTCLDNQCLQYARLVIIIFYLTLYVFKTRCLKIFLLLSEGTFCYSRLLLASADCFQFLPFLYTFCLFFSLEDRQKIIGDFFFKIIKTMNRNNIIKVKKIYF